MEDQIHFLTVVLQLQRFVRNWLIKKKKRVPLKADKTRKLNQVVYFEDSDYYETLSKQTINLKELKPGGKVKLDYRKHTYELSKAVYEGQWCGGFRHGTGRIKFNDGAVYDGQWYLG